MPVSYTSLALEELPLKDIAIAVMGANAAIGAVLLVFVGFLIIRVEALPSETPNVVSGNYLMWAKIGLVPLVALAAVIMGAYGWLFDQRCTWLFLFWSIGFVVSMVLFLTYSIITTLKL